MLLLSILFDLRLMSVAENLFDQIRQFRFSN